MKYGIIFYGGNRTCTTGQPNKTTGRMNVACGVYAFLTDADRQAWLEKENLYKPSGCGGGERIAVTKAEIRRYRRGDTIEELQEEIDFAEQDAECGGGF